MNQNQKDQAMGFGAIVFMLIITAMGFASCTSKVPTVLGQ